MLIWPNFEVKWLSYVKFIVTYALTFFGFIISVLASVKPNGMHVLLLFSLGDHRYNQRNLFWEGRNFSIGIPKQMSPPPPSTLGRP